jgi:hypothetical protein
MARKYELTETEALLAFNQVSSHCQSLKNWVAQQVEHGNFERAQELVKELRQYQEIYKKLNVEAHKFIDSI